MTTAEKKEFDALKSQVASQAKVIAALQSKIQKDEEYIALLNRGFNKLDERTGVQYETLQQTPSWAKPTIKKLIDDGALKGDQNGNLGLTTDLTRTLVIVDREGGFDN